MKTQGLFRVHVGGEVVLGSSEPTEAPGGFNNEESECHFSQSLLIWHSLLATRERATDRDQATGGSTTAGEERLSFSGPLKLQASEHKLTSVAGRLNKVCSALDPNKVNELE